MKNNNSKKTILVVDDEPFIREILKHGLKHEYKVMTADNGLKALKLIKKTKPDLVVLDVDMPVMNGMEVAWKLRKSENSSKYGDVAIIMLTKKGKGSDVEDGVSAGADVYLPKPFNLARLSEKIKVLLETV
ncbi:MAG: response regulator transcription factor [Elusimicrobiota bacterium]